MNGPTTIAGQDVVPIVLGGDSAAYTVVRSFHEAYGVRGVIVSAHLTGPVAHSRFVDNIVLPEMDEAPVLVERLQDLASELRAGGNGRLILLGSADHLVGFIVHHRAELTGYEIPYVDADLFEAVSHKEHFAQLCADLGLPHPATLAFHVGVDDPQGPELERFVAEVGFPLIVKPDNATAWHHVDFPGQHKVHTVRDRVELADLLGRVGEAGYDDKLIIQQFIAGDDQWLRVIMTYSDDQGICRMASFSSVVVEEKVPSAIGNAAGLLAGPLTDTDRALCRQAAGFLDHLGWRGWATFDVKIDQSTGRGYFFEVNPRLGRSNYLLTAQGRNPARYLTEGAPVTTAIPSGSPASTDLDIPEVERLYHLPPAWFLLRYATRAGTRRTIARLIAQRKTVHPLLNWAERDPRRVAYVTAFLANQIRKFGL